MSDTTVEFVEREDGVLVVAKTGPIGQDATWGNVADESQRLEWLAHQHSHTNKRGKEEDM